LRWVREFNLRNRLFEKTPDPQQGSELIEALHEIGESITPAYLPVQVVLPDAAMHFRVFELDELPSGNSMQHELARWRLANDLGVPEDDLSVMCQNIGISRGKHLLLAQSIDKKWHHSLHDVFEKSGVEPWAMNCGAIYRFNYYIDILKETPGGAALIALDADCWSVSFWDEEHRLRWVRSRWHENTHRTWTEDLPSYYKVLASELERTIMSYVHGDAARSVGQLFVTGEKEAILALKAVLDQRLHAMSIPLSVDLAPFEADTESNSWQLALAQVAALSEIAS